MCSSEFNLQGTIMNYLPSKELLSEVLEDEYNDRLVDWFQIEDNYLRTYYDCGRYDYKGRPTGLGIEINIYELANKCKDWAKLKELTLFSGAIENSDNEFDLEWSYDCQIFSHKEGIELFYIKCESEPESIFKACQWILDNKEIK